ncbi:hypothetical protein, partial [Escherichia coli]|uniref:hypothetical protein n=1 Tax=Escherichia coli TaxID=562 RepID=UPI0030C72BE7
GGGTFYLLRFVSINNCRHVRMPQAGYLALFSGWITRGIVLPFSGGGVVWICLLNTIRFLVSTRNVFCGECHMMMVQKSPLIAG